jgi:hypothetical protein
VRSPTWVFRAANIEFAVDWARYETDVPEWFHGKERLLQVNSFKADPNSLQTSRLVAKFLYNERETRETVQSAIDRAALYYDI